MIESMSQPIPAARRRLYEETGQKIGIPLQAGNLAKQLIGIDELPVSRDAYFGPYESYESALSAYTSRLLFDPVGTAVLFVSANTLLDYQSVLNPSNNPDVIPPDHMLHTLSGGLLCAVPNIANGGIEAIVITDAYTAVGSPQRREFAEIGCYVLDTSVISPEIRERVEAAAQYFASLP